MPNGQIFEEWLKWLKDNKSLADEAPPAARHEAWLKDAEGSWLKDREGRGKDGENSGSS